MPIKNKAFEFVVCDGGIRKEGFSHFAAMAG